MNEEMAARVCVIGNEIKEVSESDMNLTTNKDKLQALCDELSSLNSLISEVE